MCVRLLRQIGELAQKFADLEGRVGKHDKEINAIIEAIRQLMAPPWRNETRDRLSRSRASPRYRTYGNSYETHTHWFRGISNISIQWDDVPRPIQSGDVVIAK